MSFISVFFVSFAFLQFINGATPLEYESERGNKPEVVSASATWSSRTFSSFQTTANEVVMSSYFYEDDYSEFYYEYEDGSEPVEFTLAVGQDSYRGWEIGKSTLGNSLKITPSPNRDLESENLMSSPAVAVDPSVLSKVLEPSFIISSTYSSGEITKNSQDFSSEVQPTTVMLSSKTLDLLSDSITESITSQTVLDRTVSESMASHTATTKTLAEGSLDTHISTNTYMDSFFNQRFITENPLESPFHSAITKAPLDSFIYDTVSTDALPLSSSYQIVVTKTTPESFISDSFNTREPLVTSIKQTVSSSTIPLSSYYHSGMKDSSNSSHVQEKTLFGSFPASSSYASARSPDYDGTSLVEDVLPPGGSTASLDSTILQTADFDPNKSPLEDVLPPGGSTASLDSTILQTADFDPTKSLLEDVLPPGGRTASLDSTIVQTVDFDYNACSTNPCENAGTCEMDGEMGYNCTCPMGWTGTNCTQDFDECSSSPCLHGGSCTNQFDNYTCTCLPGFTGTNCQIDIDDCVNHQCANNASCEDADNSYLCNCTQFWTGPLCNQDVDECGNTTSGLYCDSHATCVNTDGGYQCACSDGYQGDGYTCQFENRCDDMPCENGFCLSKLQGYECYCQPGWAGLNCSQDVDECSEESSNDCDTEWGQCVDVPGGYQCVCREGYVGDGKACSEVMLFPYNTGSPFYGDDDLFGPYRVPAKFPFFNNRFQDIYVGMNGFLAFSRLPKLLLPNPHASLPVNTPYLAPFLADIDTSEVPPDGNEDYTTMVLPGGALHINTYAEGNDAASPKKDSMETSTVAAVTMETIVKEKVRETLEEQEGISGFQATFILVATWENVAPYPAKVYNTMENATFQAVFATDGTRSFAIFNYEPNRIQWSPNPDVRSIVIGYSDGKSAVHLLNSSLAYYPDRDSNVGKPGRYILSLGEAIENDNLPCLNWYTSQDPEVIYNMTLASDPCPCTMTQASLDLRFKVNTTANCATRHFNQGTTRQECCYTESGSLLLGYPGGGYVTLDADLSDLHPYHLCCVQTKLCHLFYNKRPSDTCARYEPPAIGGVWGDPHLRTLDGSQYTFNGRGEFLLLNVNDGRLILQGRSSPANPVDRTLANATKLTSIVVQVSNDASSRVQLRLTPDGTDVEIYLDRQDKGLLSVLQIGESLMSSEVIIEKQVDDSLTVLYSEGFALQVYLRNSLLDVFVYIPAEFQGADSTVGLLGVYDGNSDNDFKLRNGNSLVPAGSDMEYFQFGFNWTITEEESLFDYSLENGKTYTDFQYPNYVPTFFTEMLLNLTALDDGINMTQLNQVCGDITTCMIDYVTTGDAGLAAMTSMMQEKLMTIIAQTRNMPPIINMTDTIDVNIGQEVKMEVKATDTAGQRIFINVTTNINPDEWEFKSGLFTWTPSKNFSLYDPAMAYYLHFEAKDELGAAAIYRPIIKLCPCDSPLQCDWDFMDNEEMEPNPSGFYLGACSCGLSRVGEFCEQRVDACDFHPCYQGVNCTSVPGLDKGHLCDSCPQGMFGDGTKCYDQNECVDGSAMCDQTCVNQQPSYSCSCQEGFLPQQDGLTCKDIDECGETNHQCKQIGQYCINLPGSYVCGCKAGYFYDNGICRMGPLRFGGEVVFSYVNLGSLGYQSWTEDMGDATSDMFDMVADKVQAEVNTAYKKAYPNFVASKVYYIGSGSIKVKFNIFFTGNTIYDTANLQGALMTYLQSKGCQLNGPDCVVGDLLAVNISASSAGVKNLCLAPEDNDCDIMSTNCTSPGDGTFTCTCRPGYRRWLDNTNICQDIDECEEESHSCDLQRSTCVNIQGGYSCKCLTGYRNYDGMCIDICDPNPCQNNGKCLPSESNTKYTCKCAGMWTGHHCELEHTDAVRLRTLAICLGAVLGSLCILFFALMIMACMRARQARHEYSTSGEVGLESWEPTVIGRPHLTSGEFEMTENGSKQNLLSPESKYDGAKRLDPSKVGVENPAYTSTANDKKSSPHPPAAKIDSQYF